MKQLQKKTIGEIVAENYKAAAVFQSFGIDFCCKGGRTLNEVCDRRNLDAAIILDELESVLVQQPDADVDYLSWRLDTLADHIEKVHHRYVEKQIPVLLQFLDKLCRVHGKRHPELFEIHNNFQGSAGELAMHMKKEELILFPYIRRMVQAMESGGKLPDSQFGSVQYPIQTMMHEHDNEGERFHAISELSDNYTPPADGCTTYRVAFALLKEFEEDLHLHIHLENNILFPKAIALEQHLMQTIA